MALFMLGQPDLTRRVWEHKNNVVSISFTAPYNGHMLVYYKILSTYLEPARRETRLKAAARWRWVDQMSTAPKIFYQINVILSPNVVD